METKRLQGIGVNSGIVIGTVYVYQTDCPNVSRQYEEDSEVAWERYQQAKAKAEKELRELVCALEKDRDDKSIIISAHIDILTDEEIEEQIRNLIFQDHYSAEYAVQDTYQTFFAALAQMDDPVISERKMDMMDVSQRLLRILCGTEKAKIGAFDTPSILVAHDLLPSDTATLDKSKILGILTETGNMTSHTAIIAKNYGIPTILGIKDLLAQVKPGQSAILDAEEGTVIIEPDDALLQEYSSKQEKWKQEYLLEQEYVNRELYTKDGVRIFINANIGAPTPQLSKDAAAADGVGLFRTEFLYMENSHLPTEEEQFTAYCEVLQAYSGKPVILRTIDIGGDKEIPYLPLPKEDNPFLGVRAIRLCYERPELLYTQLRAALRASAYGTLEIMFPMVASMDDIRWAKSVFQQVGKDLDQNKIPWDHNIKIGIMIEVPSIMLISDHVAKEVDFASIGTNDLCQYLTASDRLNSGTVRYYQNFHPAMFRLIGYAAKEFMAQGKSLSVCGEIGGSTMAAPILVGLGIRKLSMNQSCIGKMKKELSKFRVADLEKLAQRVLLCQTETDVKRTVELFMHENQPPREG